MSKHDSRLNETALFSKTDALLWWLSTAEPELIYDCKVDRNRYRITGMVVGGTWLFATLAWSYFFSTTVSSPLVAVAMGIFMGLIVLGIDRALIKGISKSNKHKIAPLFFRGLLALTIGLFMAQPAVLYLFDKEVKMQASLDNENRRQVKRHQLDSLYAGQKTQLEKELKAVESNLAGRYAELQLARNNYLAETDGTGGSGKVGISTIALAKKKEFEKLETDFKALQVQEQPKADSLNRQLASLETNIQLQEKQFGALLNNGFLTRIEALQNLVKANSAVAFRYYLIVAILMLIELMPVIVKYMLPFGPYEEKVTRLELAERDFFRKKIEQEMELKAYYNDAANEEDRKTVDAFFERTRQAREDRITGMADDWSADKYRSFDALWRQVIREALSTPEN